ncbi:MAG: hypothetical protein JXN61_09945, partial [Sedimentisphaerales bacterium]|nr:hypothetical protein [Sedimentisphaerales bacterium]
MRGFLQATTAAILVVAASCLGQRLRAAMPPDYSIPVIDLANDTARQVIIDKEPGQYLGHPTTVLLEDNKTMIAV